MTSLVSSPLDACLVLLSVWAVIGVAGLLRPMSVTFVGRALFPIGALCGVILAFVAATSLAGVPERVTLAIGLPDLPMHLRRDALASLANIEAELDTRPAP